MAYTLFPKTLTEIKKLQAPKTKIDEILNLYAYLTSKFKSVDTPINIDPQKVTTINVSRDLDGMIDINKIKLDAKLSNIKIKFGNGSKGGRGVKNKGNLFENTYATAIQDYHAGEQVTDTTMIPSIEHLYKTYNLKKYKNLFVKQEGAANTKRPLTFVGPDIIIKADGQTGNDVGKFVTDVTLQDKENGRPLAYLSLKLGGTTTFFNVGTKTILTTPEIKANNITNINGKRLLDLFNVDHFEFCRIFNGKMKQGYNEDVWPKMTSVKRNRLEKLIQSGIGFNYHVIHKMGATIKSTKIDQRYMVEAARPRSLRIYYGGKGGTGKRIDMEILTPKYELKLNIRDTQGGDGYPTRLMGDFKYL